MATVILMEGACRRGPGSFGVSAGGSSSRASSGTSPDSAYLDIATRRNQFEVSSAALFVAYSLYIAIAAGHVCFYNSWKVDGRIRIRSKVLHPAKTPPCPRHIF
jgi:hypothetical protein